VKSARNVCSNGKATMRSVCTAELLVAARSVNVLNVSSKCSCCEFMPQAAINIRMSSCKVPDILAQF